MFIDFDQKRYNYENQNFIKIFFTLQFIGLEAEVCLPVCVKLITVLSGKIKLQNYIICRKKILKVMHQNSNNDNYLRIILLVFH